MLSKKHGLNQDWSLESNQTWRSSHGWQYRALRSRTQDVVARDPPRDRSPQKAESPCAPAPGRWLGLECYRRCTVHKHRHHQSLEATLSGERFDSGSATSDWSTRMVAVVDWAGNP